MLIKFIFTLLIFILVLIYFIFIYKDKKISIFTKIILTGIAILIGLIGYNFIIIDNKPKEQLYHRVVEQDIVGPDTIENIYFVPDSIWYKTH